MNPWANLKSSLGSRDFTVEVLHLFVLSSFAFAQPLFALLSNYAEFFVAQKSEPEDLLALTALAILVPPLPLVALEIVAGAFGKRVRKGVHGFFVAALVGLVVLHVLSRQANLPGWVTVAGAAGTGLLVGWWYGRARVLRTFLTFVSPAVLIFPAVFLLTPAIHALVFPEKVEPARHGSQARRPVPMVMVIFDEFNVTSLMSRERKVDPLLYPNFAWLAKRSHWFRNATTVTARTSHAVPAILSGKFLPTAKPTYQDYPSNIFSLLAGTHQMNVIEWATHLCPVEICPKNVGQETFGPRVARTVADLAVVFGHIILPEEYLAGLPDISQGWGDFLGVDDKFPGVRNRIIPETRREIRKKRRKNKPGLFHEFISAIPASDQPVLNFLHIALPHVPLQFLPTGRTYGPHGLRGIKKKGQWLGDPWAASQAFQRYLFQVAYVDKLLGQLLAGLKEKGLFDKSLVIITADHGVSYREGSYRRRLHESNYMDILPVPLFIKLPHQREGTISDANVLTVDILPTIADVMEIDLPQPVDGVSVFDDAGLAGRKKKWAYAFRFGFGTRIYPARLEAKYGTLEERLRLFGAEHGPEGLFALGPDRELVGREAKTLLTNRPSGLRLEVKRNRANRRYDKHRGPNLLKGTIFSRNLPPRPIRLAVAVNGTVRAVTQTFAPNTEGKRSFTFLISESAYQAEGNRIEIFAIRGTPSESVSLERLDRQKYSLIKENERRVALKNSDAERIPIVPGALRGFLDSLSVSDDGWLHLRGWAADMKNGKPAREVVLFINEQFISSDAPRYPRKGVAQALKKESFLKSGFKFSAPLGSWENLRSHDIVLYGISADSTATPLVIPEKVIPP